ncbi:MAG: SpoIID/LytB domain-containing protein [Phycisphaerales bacterium]
MSCDHGRSTRREDASAADAVTRRAFLSRVGFVTCGGVLLSGCDGGCQAEPRQPVLTAPVLTDVQLPWRPPLPIAEPIVRVRIARITKNNTSDSAIEVTSERAWLRLRMPDSRRMDFIVQSPVSVSRDERGWNVTDGSGFSPDLDPEQMIEIHPESSSAEQLLRVNGDAYGGWLRLHPQESLITARPETSTGIDLPSTETQDVDRADALAGNQTIAPGFDVVNHISMERYLPGVLARELFQHWPAETFAAQAVAARSFACAEIAWFSDRRHFDVTATQSSQAYIGATSLPVSVNAVERTRGIVLAYMNALVPGYYSSCCGGIAANANDEINPSPVNDIPPLAARQEPDACKEAPLYRWSANRSVNDISARVRKTAGRFTQGRDFALNSPIAMIEVAQRNAYGRPSGFAMTTADGATVAVASRHLRSMLNADATGTDANAEQLRSGFVDVAMQGNTFRFDGRGYGHGVGLCQYGAMALAKRGVRSEAMLAMFYPQATLHAAYGGRA